MALTKKQEEAKAKAAFHMSLVFITIFLVAFFYLYRNRVDFSGRTVRVAALIYCGLPASTLRDSEVNKLTCTAPNCVWPLVKQVIEREYRRHSGTTTTIDIRAFAPRGGDTVVITEPDNPIDGLMLLRRLHKEFGNRGLSFGAYDVRMFVNVVDKPARVREEKSLGSAAGHIGFVEWRASRSAADDMWNLTKTIHEMGHVFGASDKYDERGVSIFPGGYVEPEKGNGAVQRYVEIMSGTKAMGGADEVQAMLVNELAFSRISAEEMGWTSD